MRETPPAPRPSQNTRAVACPAVRVHTSSHPATKSCNGTIATRGFYASNATTATPRSGQGRWDETEGNTSILRGGRRSEITETDRRRNRRNTYPVGRDYRQTSDGIRVQCSRRTLRDLRSSRPSSGGGGGGRICGAYSSALESVERYATQAQAKCPARGDR